MKYWKLVLIFVFVVALVFGIIFFLLQKPANTPASQSNKTQSNPFADSIATASANLTESPATFSIDFYKWYMGNREADPNFPSTAQLTNSFPQWTTTNFILHYQSTAADLNIEEDPVLYAQDNPLQWGSGLTATILMQTNTTSSVQVLVGSGSLIHTYTVQLVKSNGQWLVDSISGTY